MGHDMKLFFQGFLFQFSFVENNVVKFSAWAINCWLGSFLAYCISKCIYMYMCHIYMREKTVVTDVATPSDANIKKKKERNTGSLRNTDDSEMMWKIMINRM